MQSSAPLTSRTPRPFKTRPRQLPQIALPAPARVLRKPIRGARILRHKRRAHLLAHLKVSRANGGREPGEDLLRFGPHRGDRRFQHARRQPAPSGVRGGHDRPIGTGEQHRQAIGHHVSRQHAASFASDRAVGGARLGFPVRIDDARAMDLLEPEGSLGSESPTLTPAVHSRDRRGIIAHVRTQG